jgi:hypothetical protein
MVFMWTRAPGEDERLLMIRDDFTWREFVVGPRLEIARFGRLVKSDPAELFRV